MRQRIALLVCGALACGLLLSGNAWASSASQTQTPTQLIILSGTVTDAGGQPAQRHVQVFIPGPPFDTSSGNTWKRIGSEASDPSTGAYSLNFNPEGASNVVVAVHYDVPNYSVVRRLDLGSGSSRYTLDFSLPAEDDGIGPRSIEITEITFNGIPVVPDKDWVSIELFEVGMPDQSRFASMNFLHHFKTENKFGPLPNGTYTVRMFYQPDEQTYHEKSQTVTYSGSPLQLQFAFP